MTDEHDSERPREQAEASEQPLGAFLRRQRELAELTLNQFASSVGISNAYLSQIERGLRKPSEGVLSAIASGLHLSAEAVEAHLPQRRSEPSAVLEAIAKDAALTARQRAAVSEMYRSFVELNDRSRSNDA
jgi:transcriptional regulator with XRE-family HTH domain